MAGEATMTIPCVDIFGDFTRSISIGGWNADGVDSNGTKWVLESLDGWDDSPPVRNTFPHRAGRHGAMWQPGFYGPRVITFTGTAWAPDQYVLAKAKATLRGLGRDLTAGVDIIGHMADGEYLVHAYRSAEIKVAPLKSRGVQFQATFTAPDHRIYSAAQHIVTASLIDQSVNTGGDWKFPSTFPYGFTPGAGAGTMLVTNAGTEPADVTISMYGPGQGLRIAEATSGSALKVAALTADQFVTIDTDDRAVLLMGYQPRRDLLAAGSEWFQIPGETTTTLSFSADIFSNAYVVVAWRDAW
jgi:hypothetical protein